MAGEAAGTQDEAARARMVTTWVAFATPMLQVDSSLQPPGFSARDLQTPARARRRRRRAGGEQDDRSDGDPGSDEGEWSDDEHLDGVYGDGGPGDDSDDRDWERDPNHDWTNSDWVGQAAGPPSASVWIKDQLRAGGAGGAGGTATAAEPPTLNPKQALAVQVVRDHAARLAAYRAAVEAHADELPLLPEPLRMVLTGTAGTGKTVVINEMVRLVGADRFMLMAPTGCAACGIGGQVSLFDL